MTDSVPGFISELIRDANEIHRLGAAERGRMLQRAAATIRDYREMVAISGAPANDSPGDIASDLAAMGRTPEAFTGKEIAAALLEAAEVVRTLRIQMRSAALRLQSLEADAALERWAETGVMPGDPHDESGSKGCA